MKNLELIKKAFSECGLIFDEKYSTIESLKEKIENAKLANVEMLDNIEEYKQWIENKKESIAINEKVMNQVEAILHQVKVERYKVLNEGLPIKEIF